MTGRDGSGARRYGTRTYQGCLQDGVNAVTRYLKNNFADGVRQDGIDLFVGNFVVDGKASRCGESQSGWEGGEGEEVGGCRALWRSGRTGGGSCC